MNGEANGNGLITRGNFAIGILALAGAVLGYLNVQTNNKIEATDKRLEKDEGIYLRVDTHDEAFRGIDRRFNEILRRLDVADRERVPRSEHERVWSSLEKDIKLLSERINEMRTRFGDNFTIGDKLKELQRQLDALHDRGGAVK